MHAPSLVSLSMGDAAMMHAYVRSGRLCLRSQFPLIDANAPSKWVHVAYEGQWAGHHSGPFELSRDDFGLAIRNHEAQANPVKLDFDHETEDAPPGSALPARGWVHELKVEDDEDGKAHLFAFVEFGPRAVQHNREGGYRFCSAVFDFGATDRVSGEEIGLRLSSLALTDEPFIDGQQPLHLSTRQRALTGESMPKLQKEALMAALEQFDSDELDMSQVEAAAQLAMVKDGAPEEDAPALQDEVEDEEDDLPLADKDEDDEEVATSDEPAGEVTTADDETQTILAPLMQATGLDEAGLAAAISENLDAVVAALQGALDEPAAEAPLNETETALALNARDVTIRQLTKRNTELEAESTARAEAEADAAVDALLTEGRILDDKRKDWRALCLSNRQSFDRLVADLQQIVPAGAHATGLTPTTQPVPETVIDEDSELVQATRRMLSEANVTDKDEQNATIRKRLSARTAQRI